MNGRLYDPKLHRFLQPDNYVQDPYNTQNYNRYGYVLNNPLKYIDPSGEYFNGPPVGIDREDGSVWEDEFGKWIYNQASKTWKGQNGTANVYNAIPLNEVVVGGKSSTPGSSNSGFSGYVGIGIGTLSAGGGLWDNFNKNVITTTNAVAGIFETGVKLSGTTTSTVRAFNPRVLAATLADAKVLKIAGAVSLVGNVSQVGLAASQYISDPTAGNATRVAVQVAIIGIEVGLNSVAPGLGVVVGFGLSAAESVYGQQLYDYIDK